MTDATTKAAAAPWEFDQVRVVPKTASSRAIDAALPWFTGWQHMRIGTKESNLSEVYTSMVCFSPDTGYVAVRRDLLQKMFDVIDRQDCFNSFTSEEEIEMQECLK
jgi:hypothetical protein